MNTPTSRMPPSPRPTPSDPSPALASGLGRAPSPETLLGRYRTTGDPEALGMLFDGTAPVLFRMALSLTADATVAEDCVQETYLAALESLEKYDATRAVMPWLVGILQIMVRRARHERGRVPDPIRVAAAHPAVHGEAAGDDAAIDVEHDEEAKQIRGAIDSLDEPYRSVALLRWRYGLSPAEIADVRGEPPGTVRSLLSRALERMRGLLKATPALGLLPLAPFGLAAVRDVVLARGAELGIGMSTASVAASGWLALSKATLVKSAIAAAALFAIGGGWFAWRAGRGGGEGGAPSAAERSNESSAVHPDRLPRGADANAAGTSMADEPKVAVAPAEPRGASTPAVPPIDSVAPGSIDTGGHEPDVPTAPPEGPDLTTDPHLGVGEGMDGGMVPEPAPVAPAPVPSASDPSDDDGVPKSLGDRIDKAVANGVRWLKQRQLPNGSWGIVEGNASYSGGTPQSTAYTHPAGPTALALYALLKCGEPLEDPYVKRGFSYLRDRQKKPGGAYETAMMLLAVTATADPFKKTVASIDAGEKVKFPSGDWQTWARALHEQLLAKRARAKMQGWRYMVDGNNAVEPGGNEDLSSTQLSALALLAAERCGIKTDAKVWLDILRFAMRQQESDGPAHDRAVYDAKSRTGAAPSGGYAPVGGEKKDRARGFAYIRSDTLDPDEGAATGGMTACGVGSLMMGRYVLAKRDDKSWEGVDQKAIEQAAYDGLAWLDRHWSPYANPMKKRMNVYHIYYMYCVERCLDLVGNVMLGKHRWYVEMANELVARQSSKGYWDSDSTHKPGEVLDTSFALLFLRRATKIYGAVTDPDDAPPVDRR